MIGMLTTPSRTSASAAASDFIATSDQRKTEEKHRQREPWNLRPNLSQHSAMSLCRRALLLLTTNLVVPKKCTPGATAEHERLHERSFGLDGVVQIVSRPGVQHLCQRDDTQRGMLLRPSQTVICHVFEQDKACFSSACERSHQLLGSQRLSACVRFVRIEIDELLSCQKSVEAHRKNQALSVQ